MTATFYGHRECPGTIRPLLKSQLEDLIENYGVDLFYVGNQGQFDAMVRSVLRELSAQYPAIQYGVVLAYFPGSFAQDDEDTMLPEGIEEIHPKYALAWRNQWMLDRCDIAVVYVKHSWGGAAKYAQKAKKKGKRVINLA